MNVFKTVGKAVLVEGTKAITITAGLCVIVTLAESGVSGVKELSLKNLLK